MGENCTTLALNLTGNATLECPCYDDQDDYQISSLAFWIEGISQFIVAIFGVIGNLISAFILSRYFSNFMQISYQNKPIPQFSVVEAPTGH